MIDALREAAIQALLLALRIMAPVTAVAAVVGLVGVYTMLGAACLYASSWLVREALNFLTNTN